jgi:hypothetical protein
MYADRYGERHEYMCWCGSVYRCGDNILLKRILKLELALIHSDTYIDDLIFRPGLFAGDPPDRPVLRMTCIRARLPGQNSAIFVVVVVRRDLPSPNRIQLGRDWSNNQKKKKKKKRVLDKSESKSESRPVWPRRSGWTFS